MRKKFTMTVAVALVVVATFVSFKVYKINEVNEFPLTEGIIEATLHNEGLNWNISEKVVQEEDVIAYEIENTDVETAYSIITSSIDDERVLQLSFITHTFGVQKDNGRLLEYNNWKATIKSTCILFGNEKFHEEILKDLNNYIVNDENKTFQGVGLREQYGNSYVTILLESSKNSVSKYGIRSILMTDKKGFEKSLMESAEFWKMVQVNEGAEVIENCSISETLTRQKSTDETVVIINGYLNNIEELDEVSLDFKSLNGEYFKDYKSANLVDEKVNIPVVLRNSALSNVELSVPRVHYAKYYKNDDIFVIYASVLDE